MSPQERQLLWDRVMQAESKDVAAYFENWFFNVKFEDLTHHEIQNFITWGYFDGRNQEHLTDDEHKQLDAFVEKAVELVEKQKNNESNGVPPRKKSARMLPPLTKDATDLFRKLDVQRRVLAQVLPQAHDVPEAQMAQVMRSITKSHKELLQLERASLPASKTPQLRSRRFGRPTSDRILGVYLSC